MRAIDLRESVNGRNNARVDSGFRNTNFYFFSTYFFK